MCRSPPEWVEVGSWLEVGLTGWSHLLVWLGTFEGKGRVSRTTHNDNDWSGRWVNVEEKRNGGSFDVWVIRFNVVKGQKSWKRWWGGLDRRYQEERRSDWIFRNICCWIKQTEKMSHISGCDLFLIEIPLTTWTIAWNAVFHGDHIIHDWKLMGFQEYHYYD
jgi:hypothetical protein